MSLGPMELALIVGLALLIFGPSRLPGLGRSLGDAIRGFKKGMSGDDEKPADRAEQLTSSESDRNSVKNKDKTQV